MEERKCHKCIIISSWLHTSEIVKYLGTLYFPKDLLMMERRNTYVSQLYYVNKFQIYISKLYFDSFIHSWIIQNDLLGEAFRVIKVIKVIKAIKVIKVILTILTILTNCGP